MNLTTVLDVAAQRSATPLDRPVSDSSEPAFANVMSQVRKRGDEKPADSATPPQDSAETQSNSAADDGSETPASNAAAQQPTADADPRVDRGAPSNEVQADTDGETLPVEAAVAGETLPPLNEVVGDVGGTAAAEPANPKAEDGAVDDDPSAALLFAALVAPPQTAPPQPAPQPAANVRAPPLTGSAAAASAPSLPKANDASAPASQPAPDPAQLQAALDRPAPSADLRAPSAATSQSAVAQALAQAAAAQRDAQQPPAVASIAQTLHSFVRPQQLGAESGNPTAMRRDPRIRSVDMLDTNAAAAKTPIAQLASLIEGAAQKDPATTHQDAADASMRTDAITQRTNGTPEAPRDMAATRLNDLAQLHAQRFAGELADRVLVLRSQRLDTATVTLEPRDLGRIDIQVRLQADTTHVAFTAQHAAVRDALEGQMPRLRAMLEDAGLSLGAVDVSHSGGQSGTDAGAPRSHETQKSTSTVAVAEGIDGSARWQRRVDNALIDLHA